MTTALPRRTVLASGATAAGAVTLAPALPTAAAGGRRRRVFAHGVASGDPLPGGVVIWTRVTPTSAASPGSGRGPRVTVRWEVARDAGFRDVVRRGTFATGPSRDHTVKVDVTGLRPATWYHYRFTWDGVRSRTGRTRTAPATRATPRNLRLGVVSCANWQAGWFSAYRHLAKRDDLHAVVCLGDYLYEYAPGEYGMGQGNVDVRRHDPPREMVDLGHYRRRHAQYKTDPDLQELHAVAPWIVTWDDHEVTNDQWRRGAENHQPGEGDYLRRRARAHRAYDEWMPVRLSGTADLRDGTRLFRSLRFGRLAQLSMLDLRTHRSQQAADPTTVSDPKRTITGRRQMAWLRGALDRRPQWKLVGNPVMIAPVDFGTLPDALTGAVRDVTGLLPEDGVPYNTDQWDGYTADRNRVFAHIADRGLRDVVFVTGDIHSGWACELPYDAATYAYENPARRTAGVEFVCSSVTSNNLKDITGDPTGATSTAVEEGIRANNRHVRYLNFDDHGFSVLDLTPERAQMDWYVLTGPRDDRSAGIRHETSWRTRSGTGRIEQVDTPVGGPA
ncbi:alkaline phosphatase D family protein [Nocardioides euryhalodurans]|uniref:Alkaline phosphatase n=1 Tax=Nocardioides euryhalodurans TaxID=2518370 RepID=A0A4P7GJV9_9ACTN|nr:alkaline phosphatase D family protein [Nocardioides euryhalodurans]QBR92286.1 alkaline phosphatase [Nocardioides euryhalodurans]